MKKEKSKQTKKKKILLFAIYSKHSKKNQFISSNHPMKKGPSNKIFFLAYKKKRGGFFKEFITK